MDHEFEPDGKGFSLCRRCGKDLVSHQSVSRKSVAPEKKRKRKKRKSGSDSTWMFL